VGVSLDDVRRRIDALDDRILDLLDERARLAADAARTKRDASQALHDPEREARLLERLEQRQRARADAAFPRGSVRPVFREILSACLSVETPISVAYLGPPGTFTHMATQRAFGLAARYVEASTISGVFDAVERGGAGYGVVPIENSTEGGVSSTLDCLLESAAIIRNELVLDVAHCLLGAHAELGRVERVYSHPQALAQCRGWLARNLPHAQLVVSPSTAAAAREASLDAAAAAIASRLAAEIHGLEVIRERIQDRAENATRFVVIGTSPAPPTGRDKTSIVFSTRDERGALLRALVVFDEEGLNLSRIESRPAQGKLWEYVFFTDLEGHRDEPPVERALRRLGESGAMVKVLGSYPRAD
jgi:chorismate mutase/prephenate dehydratase